MKLIIWFAITIFSMNVIAADGSGNYAIWGAGNKSCHSYNQAQAAGDDEPYKNFTMGYLTSYNHQANETYSISSRMNLDEVMAWIGEECELKPIISFEEALVNFIVEHHEKRMKNARSGFGH